MKIIGVVTRKLKSESNLNIDIVYDAIVKIIKNNNALPIGIILEEDYKNIINICNGLIFQGGDDIESYDLDALKYAYDLDIPVLGICLGMQEMGVLFGGELINIENHKSTLDYVHNIKIKRNTKLYNILKKDIIKVNSRHKSVVNNTKLRVSAVSSDGYIEAVEDNNKTFFIGVQWHPESMMYDSDQSKILKAFIDVCNSN